MKKLKKISQKNSMMKLKIKKATMMTKVINRMEKN